MRNIVLVVASAVALAACKGQPPKPGGTGEIPIVADENGFNPSSITVPKGAPATLVFTRTTEETCATEVVFPELDIKKPLPKGTAVKIVVPTDKEQKLTFQCGMGMYKSAVVVGSQ